ncbi:MAG: nucleotide exchange factor GrpE [Bacteroidetes bacterium]|nr:nucleotide exchange factor GrpE [Bacteroidota bacterium]
MKHTKNNADENVEMNINADEAVSGSIHLNDPVAEESEMEQLKTELDESKDKYLRLMAEFENFKRRNAKERVELIQTAGRDVITDMLDILDDCDRAQKQIQNNKNAAPEIKGVLLVFNKLKNTLQARGLKEMESIHADFNPDLHEAITEIPAPTEELKGKVVDEILKGYYLNDKIIRHAKVVVGK